MPQRLTNAIVEGLPAPERGSKIHYDSESKGFGVRVSVGGTQSFVLNYRVRGSGQERRYTIGQFPNWTATAARTRAQELKRQIDEGGDPVAELQDQWAITLHERVARKIASFVELSPAERLQFAKDIAKEFPEIEITVRKS